MDVTMLDCSNDLGLLIQTKLSNYPIPTLPHSFYTGTKHPYLLLYLNNILLHQQFHRCKSQ